MNEFQLLAIMVAAATAGILIKLIQVEMKIDKLLARKDKE